MSMTEVNASFSNMSAPSTASPTPNLPAAGVFRIAVPVKP